MPLADLALNFTIRHLISNYANKCLNDSILKKKKNIVPKSKKKCGLTKGKTKKLPTEGKNFKDIKNQNREHHQDVYVEKNPHVSGGARVTNPSVQLKEGKLQ